jgi:carboxyl-terminal processing protease
MIILLVMVSSAISFGAGCVLQTENRSELEQALKKIEEVWGIIYRDYVELDALDAKALTEGAIKGMVDALDDPYSAYLDVESYELSVTHWEGRFEGIGAYVGIENGNFMIIAPIDGSPADRAGIRAGDIVLEVNDEPTSEMSLMDAILKIRGPRGTSVKLLILHKGETESVEIEIVRAEIEVPSVNLEMREAIAYLEITNFTERTDEELVSAIREIDLEGATGIVLDLRSNPGGLLSAVVDVAGRFIKDGVVVYVVDNQGRKTSSSISPKSVRTDLPIVVLVDEYSASGSEVLAGALQDYARATIAGTTTYGKGSVNVPHMLKDGSGLYLTTARWQTPEGHLIEGEGIEPDYPLELEEEDAIQWAIDYLKSNK